jgi:hypothetical protein
MSDYIARSDTLTDRQMIWWYMMINVRLPKKHQETKAVRRWPCGTAWHCNRHPEAWILWASSHWHGDCLQRSTRCGESEKQKLYELIRWRLEMIRVGLKRLVCGFLDLWLIFDLWSIWWFWSAFCGTLMQGHHGGRSFWQSNSQLLWLEAKLFAMCGLKFLVFRCRIFRPLMFWPGSYDMVLQFSLSLCILRKTLAIFCWRSAVTT